MSIFVPRNIEFALNFRFDPGDWTIGLVFAPRADDAFVIPAGAKVEDGKFVSPTPPQKVRIAKLTIAVALVFVGVMVDFVFEKKLPVPPPAGKEDGESTS